MIVYWGENFTGFRRYLGARWAGDYGFVDSRIGVIVDISFALVGESCDIGSGASLGERVT